MTDRTSLYFAYGSNLSTARMVGRVPSASPRGAARAEGFSLHLDKRGADGSGKANIHPTAGAVVWGAVYALDAAHWAGLDACEGGYERIEIEVRLGTRPTRVQTYRSQQLTDEPVARTWYKRLMLDGAREHRLPAEWLAQLDALPARD